LQGQIQKVGTMGKRKGVHGSSKSAGVIGIEFDELTEQHTAFEHSDWHIENPNSNDWIEIEGEGFFYKGVIDNFPRPSRAVELDYRIQEEIMPDARGTTRTRFYLELAIEEKGQGKFVPHFKQAIVDSTIRVNRKSNFDSLAQFKKYYDEFLSMVKLHGSRTAGFQAFASKHITSSGNEYSTDFAGKRAKTVEHEVHHLRHAQEQAQALGENLLEELRKMGHKKSGHTPWKRCRGFIEIMGRGWNSDMKGKFHRRIVEHDCLVMIAIYEAFALPIEEAKANGNPDPMGGLFGTIDYLTIELMEGIGEPIETWGD